MQHEPNAVDAARRAALEMLFRDTYPKLRDAVFETEPTLTNASADLLLRSVARTLDQYPGADDDSEEFTEWALRTITEGASLLTTLNTLKGKYRGFVRKAIQNVLDGCFDLGPTYPGTIDELESQTWWRVFVNLDEWLAPPYGNDGRPPAQLSTRLSEFARLQAMGWKTDRLRHRKKFGQLEESEYRGAKGKKKPSLSQIERRAA